MVSDTVGGILFSNNQLTRIYGPTIHEKHKPKGLYQCSCGNIKTISTAKVNSDQTKSCGCLKWLSKHVGTPAIWGKSTKKQGVCILCKRRKQSAKGNGKFYSRCYTCMNGGNEGLAKKRQKRSLHKKQHDADKQRDRFLRISYGITLEQFKEMNNKQEGKCLLCKQLPAGRWKTLNVDHNHTTGAVRGLLCHTCNLGIGYLKEDPTILANAIKYLAKGN